MQQFIRIGATVVEKLKNLFNGKSKPVESNVSLSEEKPPQLTQADKAKILWDKVLLGDKAAAMELLAFKKKAKKGWTVWGLPSTAGDTLKMLLDP